MLLVPRRQRSRIARLEENTAQSDDLAQELPPRCVCDLSRSRSGGYSASGVVVAAALTDTSSKNACTSASSRVRGIGGKLARNRLP
jgi:hypothetical protein